MSVTELETTRNRIAICCIVAGLAAAICGLALLNAAELQAAAMISGRAGAPEASERPALDIGVVLIAMGAIAPVVVAAIAFWKRWSLSYYLALIVATVLLVLMVSAAAAFATYQYWREHQAIAASDLRAPTPQV